VAGTFINYRRDDSAGYAGRLHEALERKLGHGRIFRDVDTLEPGQDFVGTITDRVRQCRVFLALIGRQWLEARDASGQRRIDATDDYVRLELAEALARTDLVVVPVLLEGATMPAARDLPEPIRALTYRHAISLRDESWDEDVERLARIIAKADRVEAPPAAAVHDRRSPARRVWIPVAAIALVVIALLVWRNGGDASPEPPGTADRTTGRVAATRERPVGSSGPTAGAIAIAVPRVAEVAHGTLIYSLLDAGVTPGAPANTLRLRFRVSNEGRYDANLWDSSFRLVVNQEVLTPTSGLNELVAGSSVKDAVVTFEVPQDARAATLRIVQGDQQGDLPLDLSSHGDGAAQAAPPELTATLVREPVVLVPGGLTLRSATARRFANVIRLSLPVIFRNEGRYDYASGGFTMRLATPDGLLLAPFLAPNEVVRAASTAAGTYVFDVPPDTQRVVLQASAEGTPREFPLDLTALPR
jgi:hypothetical protein